jgi:hypothetical protein
VNYAEQAVAADSVKGHDEDVMRKKLRDSMQPLSPHAILVLGMPACTHILIKMLFIYTYVVC